VSVPQAYLEPPLLTRRPVIRLPLQPLIPQSPYLKGHSWKVENRQFVHSPIALVSGIYIMQRCTD
jgi:hypothetical protein